MQRWALELIVVLISLGIFIAYHCWVFFIHDRVHPGRLHSAWAMGKKARSVACVTWCSDEKDVVNGIQCVRNAMTAVTFLSALTGILATLIVPIMLDSSKTQRIEQLALQDPILRNATGPPLAPPVAVLGCGLGVLWAAFCFFAQSMRLYVHLGFLLRAIPSPYNHDREGKAIFSELDARRVSVKAGFAFTIALRLWYLFVVVIAWAFGATALLVASCAVTLMVWRFDQYDVRGAPEDELDDDECAHGADAALLEADTLRQREQREQQGAAANASTTQGDGVVRDPSLAAGMGGGGGGGDIEAGGGRRPVGVPMTALSPAVRLATPSAPSQPPDRASSLQLADLSRLSSDYSALSWNRCPGHDRHSHRPGGRCSREGNDDDRPPPAAGHD
jgi:uncharacterized membrane protein